jgi:hypothetical protein
MTTYGNQDTSPLVSVLVLVTAPYLKHLYMQNKAETWRFVRAPLCMVIMVNPIHLWTPNSKATMEPISRPDSCPYTFSNKQKGLDAGLSREGL